MLNFFRTLLINSVIILGISPAVAADPLMTVELPLTNTQEQQIAPLLSQGLTTVLTRLTGNPTIAEQKAVTDIINNPNDYLEKYSQQTEPDRLVMLFDQRSIESALNKLQIGYWTNNRPLIMIWWLNETTNGTLLAGDDPSITKIISTAANLQGFPLRFPIADLNEQALANKDFFSSNLPKELLNAAKQYMTNATLIVYMQQKDNNYQANWQLWLSNDDTKPLAQAEIKGTTEQQVADQIFAAVNLTLAKIFIIKENAATENLDIIIKGLSFASYVEVNNLMTSFNAKIVETTGSTVHYQVKANPTQITAQLSLLHLTQQKESSPSETGPKQITTLVFQASDQ